MIMTKHLLFAFVGSSLVCGCTLVPGTEPIPKPSTTTTVEITAQWQVAPDRAVGEMAAASAGDEGAIAYAESEGHTADGFTQTRIKLQRLDSTGAIRGAAVELGVIPFEGASRITLASDGVRYIACWNGDDDKIDCATVPVGEGDASPALSTDGRWPSLAYGPGGWALAHGIAQGVVVVHLNNDGSAAGNAALIDTVGTQETPVFLSATESGFILMGKSDDSAHVQVVDNALSSVALPIDLGLNFWFHAAMAVSGTTVAVFLGKPYGGYLVILDQAAVLMGVEFDNIDFGKEGMNAALGPDGTSFGMLSADGHFGLHYGLIDGVGSSQPSEVEVNMEGPNYDRGSLAILNIKGEQFLAATGGRWQLGGSVVVARVRRQ
jgi:hypothetical protein